MCVGSCYLPISTRMSKLREFARGKECQLRFEGCSYNPEETVLAHVRMGGVAGTGTKPPDCIGIHACHSCHEILDARKKRPEFMSEADFYRTVLEALCRTLNQVHWFFDA